MEENKATTSEETSKELASPAAVQKDPVKESPFFKQFREEFERLPSVEEKVSSCLLFMKESLLQNAHPRFRDFWAAKQLCLPLFKELTSLQVKSDLWAQYLELSTEARHLKKVLEEQSAFTIEQIELAIGSLGKEIDGLLTLLETAPLPLFPDRARFLRDREEFYAPLQKELSVLNVLAVRVNAFRKEVLQTEMRIKYKSKFLEKLSLFGDKIFPRRKELIKQVSEGFSSDVDRFVALHFTKEKSTIPYYALKEEIKGFQSLAKELTIDTASFRYTREKLSQCWEKLKEWEKESKKEFSERQGKMEEVFKALREKISSFAALCTEENQTLSSVRSPADELLKEIKALDLTREEMRQLQDEIRKAQDPLFEKERAAEEKVKQHAREQKEKIAALHIRFSEMLQKMESLSLAELELAIKNLSDELAALPCTKAQQEQFQSFLRRMKDQILGKKAKELGGEMGELMQLLEAQMHNRKEIREEIEKMRKELGKSNLDFEKAMEYQERIDIEKDRLDSVNNAIEELEERIAELNEE